jgi:hypothetical protein
MMLSRGNKESHVVSIEHVNTTTHLLDGLFDTENQQAWAEFDSRYRPILIGFLKRMGLSDADAADVAQDTLTCFVQDYRAKVRPRQGPAALVADRHRPLPLRRSQAGRDPPPRGARRVRDRRARR